MAFQQPQARRKQTLHSPPRCTTPDAVQSPLATSDQDEEEGVLLFSLSDSQASWTLLASPRRARLSRLHSYGSSSQLTTSPGGSPLQIELDHSLLPSHDGTGAFAQASSLRGTSVGSTQGESEEGELIGRMRGRGRRESRTTQGTETDESVQGSELDGNSDQGRWELTEQALESLHSSNRLGLFHPRDQEQDEEGSAGFTSGSEEEEEDRGSESQRSRRKGKGRRTNEQEEEMEQSLSALSAGITPRARRQLASRSPSNRPPLLPIVGETSTSQRSLSPYYNISTLSQTSSDGFSVGSNGVRYKSKRRHRNAGSGSQSKRLLEMGKFERIEEEEAKRAERMKGVLEERIKENEIAGAKKEILMGEHDSLSHATRFAVSSSEDFFAPQAISRQSSCRSIPRPIHSSQQTTRPLHLLELPLHPSSLNLFDETFPPRHSIQSATLSLTTFVHSAMKNKKMKKTKGI